MTLTTAAPGATFLRVAVGSTNPAKIRAAEQALKQVLHSSKRKPRHINSHTEVHLAVEGFAVESGVPDQPFGDDDTCQGAKNRSNLAYAAYMRANGRPPHLAIGMEGGLEWRIKPESSGADRQQKDLYCMAWMAIYGCREGFTVDIFASADTGTYSEDTRPVYGLAKTASFALPPSISELVEQGFELGDADDKVFDRVKSKHGSGAVGILTDNLVDRSYYYEHALMMAFTPWIRPDLYPEGLS
jgi:non-canonical (house-cleaning) NTP pyrophosphatase